MKLDHGRPSPFFALSVSPSLSPDGRTDGPFFSSENPPKNEFRGVHLNFQTATAAAVEAFVFQSRNSSSSSNSTLTTATTTTTALWPSTEHHPYSSCLVATARSLLWTHTHTKGNGPALALAWITQAAVKSSQCTSSSTLAMPFSSASIYLSAPEPDTRSAKEPQQQPLFWHC